MVVSCLPPTMEIKALSERFGTQMTAHVSYHLDAYAVVDGLITCSARRQIFVEDDTLGIPPPIFIEDFPGEYKCSEGKQIFKFWPQRQTLSVDVSQPNPLLFRAHCDKAVVHCLFEMHCSPCTDLAELPTAVALQWHLQTMTFNSVVPMEKSPTLAQAARSDCISASKERSEFSFSDRSFGRWHRVRGRNDMWETPSWFVLVIQAPLDRLPTFSSPFLSRRYSLGLQLKLRSHVWTKYELVVPLHIMFETNTI